MCIAQLPLASSEASVELLAVTGHHMIPPPAPSPRVRPPSPLPSLTEDKRWEEISSTMQDQNHPVPHYANSRMRHSHTIAAPTAASRITDAARHMGRSTASNSLNSIHDVDETLDDHRSHDGHSDEDDDDDDDDEGSSPSADRVLLLHKPRIEVDVQSRGSNASTPSLATPASVWAARGMAALGFSPRGSEQAPPATRSVTAGRLARQANGRRMMKKASSLPQEREDQPHRGERREKEEEGRRWGRGWDGGGFEGDGEMSMGQGIGERGDEQGIKGGKS